MSILEVIVLLIGGSVIAFLLYGAYRFWTEDADTVAAPQGSRKVPAHKKPARTSAKWPTEPVSGHRSS
jgi:hypothetical protein